MRGGRARGLHDGLVLLPAAARDAQGVSPLNIGRRRLWTGGGAVDIQRALATRQLRKVVKSVQVMVRDNNVDQALRALKKKMQREGVFREMKLRQHYEKPSVKCAREQAEAIRRARKLARKKLQREGLA